MNTIYQRTTPAIRFKIQGIYLCEKLNKHLLLKKKAEILFLILLLIIRIVIL